MRLVLLGSPGAGKGTQGRRLAEHYGVPLISTGDIFRSNAQNDTELGREARSYMEAGDLVPDELVVRMVLETLAKESDGVILDGFPRNIVQAKALEEALAFRDQPLTAALVFDVEDRVVLARLTGRRTCRRCQRTYHLEFKPPRVECVCDVCGGELFQRQDDQEAPVRHRVELYHENMAPLVDYYEQRGLLRRIDADGPVEEVTHRALEALSVRSSP